MGRAPEASEGVVSLILGAGSAVGGGLEVESSFFRLPSGSDLFFSGDSRV